MRPDPSLRDAVINELAPTHVGCQDTDCDTCDDTAILADRALTAIAGWLPDNNADLAAWLNRHKLGDAGPGAVIAALRSDLTEEIKDYDI